MRWRRLPIGKSPQILNNVLIAPPGFWVAEVKLELVLAHSESIGDRIRIQH